MQPIRTGRAWPLYGAETTRALEARAAAGLPAHTLMQRAGLAVARLALAVAPHAQRIWLACGPGNNGGDGLEAAAQLAALGRQPVVSWLGDPSRAPADARASLARAQAAGLAIAAGPPDDWDLGIDALFGLGSGPAGEAVRPLEGPAGAWAQALGRAGRPVLAVDLPSGLNADTGQGAAVRASHTLSLLTLKPGLFTGAGRDACGEVWFDDLGCAADAHAAAPDAWLAGPPPAAQRPHDSHKGRYGEVAVLGGAPGMAGAALLAARAALHAGAGRVFVHLLDPAAAAVDPAQPELMLRPFDAAARAALTDRHLVCGCGGGDAVRAALPAVLAQARTLVLDADALNAIAADAGLRAQLVARGRRCADATVLTPHPLEAARLLGCGTAQVQADRLAAACALADEFHGSVLLKGSGSVIASPGQQPCINPTGNARLATAGTGDVLTGLLGARMAGGLGAHAAACAAAWAHGQAADRWPAGRALTAAALAAALQP